MWNERQTWVHNGSHRPPPYFEWWYFHFVTPEGIALNAVLHETDIFGHRDTPYLSLSLLRPDKPAIYLKRDLAPESIIRNWRCLRVGNSLLLEGRHRVFFDISFPGQALLKGELVKLAPPLVFGDGVLLEDGQTGRANYWMVTVPYATFTAQLHLDGEVLNLCGTAYQDHQWGTLPLQEMVSDWTWGHFSNPQLAIVFFQIRSQRGHLIQRVGVTAAGDQFTDTSLDSGFLHTLSQAAEPEEHTGDIEVGFFNRNLGLTFAVSPAGLMRQRTDERLGNKIVTYLRWAAKGTYEDACSGQDVYGISEYIRIRPGNYGSLPEPEHHQHHLWDYHGD